MIRTSKFVTIVLMEMDHWQPQILTAALAAETSYRPNDAFRIDWGAPFNPRMAEDLLFSPYALV